jgi:hypothetical protein
MLVPPQDFIFIADEAGISNDRYTVIGGIAMHRNTLEDAYPLRLKTLRFAATKRRNSRCRLRRKKWQTSS